MTVADEIIRLQTAKADIKNAIEEKGVIVGDGTIDTYAEKINEIQGGAGGSFDEGYEEGKKAQYDAFWDMFQDKGNRTDYRYAFYGAYTNNKYWDNIWLRPKHDMVCSGQGIWMFAYADAYELKKGYEGKENLGLDTSALTNAGYMFYNSRFRELPLIDLSKVTIASDATAIFSLNTHLKKLHLKVSENTAFNTTNNYAGTFYYCISLENLIIEGTTAKDINLQNCPLTKASIESVISALSETVGATLTLNKQAVNNAFGINVDNPTTYPEGSEYYTLRNSKSNWTFNYA